MLVTFQHRCQVFTLLISTALMDTSTPSSLTQFKHRGILEFLGATCLPVMGTMHVAVGSIMGTEDVVFEGRGTKDMVVESRYWNVW